MSLPKTFEWKQIQFFDMNSFPWYKISFCKAQVKPTKLSHVPCYLAVTFGNYVFNKLTTIINF